MLEIEDATRRDRTLRTLGNIEETAFLDLDGERIQATPTEYEDRTTPEGKTSSVQWLRFSFTPKQVATFKDGRAPAVLGFTHPNYGHMAVIAPQTRAELAKDFA
jgi:hypothetical protein